MWTQKAQKVNGDGWGVKGFGGGDCKLRVGDKGGGK